MITLEFTDAATMEQQAVQAGLTLPIEQTAVWAKYQNTIDGRTPCFSVNNILQSARSKIFAGILVY